MNLSTSFVDVTSNGILVGQTHEVGTPLDLWNRSESDVDVQVKAITPSDEQLREGVAPLANPSWVRIVPDHFSLVAGAKQRCRVYITLPKGTKMSCQDYQVMIWSQGTLRDSGGISMSAGLMSRLLIRTISKTDGVCK